MTEFISQNLETLLAFVTGGGLLSFATLKYARKQAEADAMKSVQDVYQETIQNLREDKMYLSEEISELRREVAEIRKNQDLLQKLKCTVENCKQRRTE